MTRLIAVVGPVLALATVLLSATPSEAQHSLPKAPADIAEATLPSVVLLLVTADVPGKPARLASGFIVKGDLIATNFHVVAGAASVQARIIGQPAMREMAATGVVATDEANDLVLVKVPGLRAPALRLGDDGRLR